MNTIRSAWSLAHLLATRSNGLWRFTRPLFEEVPGCLVAIASLGVSVFATATLLNVRSLEESYSSIGEFVTLVTATTAMTGFLGETANRILPREMNVTLFAGILSLAFPHGLAFAKMYRTGTVSDLLVVETPVGLACSVAGVVLGVQAASLG